MSHARTTGSSDTAEGSDHDTIQGDDGNATGRSRSHLIRGSRRWDTTIAGGISSGGVTHESKAVHRVRELLAPAVGSSGPEPLERALVDAVSAHILDIMLIAPADASDADPCHFKFPTPHSHKMIV
eukprot:COSAG06_NODE_5513_length_3429_cov_1.853629_2_plen_126_part_00